MTTKIISTVYGAPYQLSAPVTTLSITASGYLAGGLTTAGAFGYTIVNDGGIAGTAYGLSLDGPADLTNAGRILSVGTTAGAAVTGEAGGVVTNASGGEIDGYSGVVLAGAAGTVTNDGSIFGQSKYGVDLAAGGSVTNAAGATIKGVKGVAGAGPLTVNNSGLVIGTGTAGAGAYLSAGGEVINAAGGDIRGYEVGVESYNVAARLINYGAIYSPKAGVYLKGGGEVINGSISDRAATITGRIAVGLSGTGETVLNYGALEGHLGGVSAGVGVVMLDGGEVVNGAAGDTTAVIAGNAGVAIGGAAGTVTNFALIGGTTIVCIAAVALTNGGTVTNGSASDTTALIIGYAGVVAETITATVRNFATIAGGVGEVLPRYEDAGVYLSGGGSVSNGATNDAKATISGYRGVSANYAAATVTNLGTVSGSVSGVDLAYGGRLVNGLANHAGALIEGGAFGVEVTGAAGTIDNSGTILGGTAEPDYGVYLAQGVLTNGSAGDRAALIQARSGLELGAGARATNFAVIRGVEAAPELGLPWAGAVLQAGASLTNEAGATIVGEAGVESNGGATITNFGTIDGDNGNAAILATGDRLNAEAGSALIGIVAAGAALVDVVGGTATMTLSSAGKVEGAGTLALAGGVSTFSAGARLVVAEISVTGAATDVEVSANLTDAEVWRQSAGTLTIETGDHVTFEGVGDSFSGTLAGAGVVDFYAGSDAIANATLSARTHVGANATVTLTGNIDLTSLMVASRLTIATAGASLTGGGTVDMANAAGSQIAGATASARLTNADTLRGAGQLGDGELQITNTASGVIEGAFSTALVINTGTATLANAGLIENLSTGGLVIDGAVVNTGTLAAVLGTLTLAGALSGAGELEIDGGTLDLSGAFSGDVTFTDAAGSVLALAHSTTDTVSVTGFSTTGASSFDLQDIVFDEGTRASFTGTATSGVLTVTDGTHTAKLTLEGNYTASTFTVGSDGHGGTLVTDPRAPDARALTAALAAFGGGRAGGMTSPAPAPDRLASPLAASSRA
jgi:hypothetical protein